MREARRRVLLVLLLLLLIASLMYGCAQDVSSDSSVSVPSAAVEQTPEEVIRDFFLAAGRHDSATMQALMSTYYRSTGATWVLGDEDVLLDMSALEVYPTRPSDESDLASRPGRYRDYYAVRNGTVHYVQLTDSQVIYAGPQIRFVTVVKETETSPWRIEEIGTGP